jgi:hypothetical protein
MDQVCIDAFAEIEDLQFIHIDPVRAAGTILWDGGARDADAVDDVREWYGALPRNGREARSVKSVLSGCALYHAGAVSARIRGQFTLAERRRAGAIN